MLLLNQNITESWRCFVNEVTSDSFQTNHNNNEFNFDDEWSFVFQRAARACDAFLSLLKLSTNEIVLPNFLSQPKLLAKNRKYLLKRHNQHTEINKSN